MEKTYRHLLMVMLAAVMSLGLAACGDDNDNEPQDSAVSIVGKWADGDFVLTFSRDGSYREDASYGQYRIGTYSYSPETSLLAINVKAIPGMNSAYKDIYVVQTLSATTLVLMYTDGSIKGYFTRQ